MKTQNNKRSSFTETSTAHYPSIKKRVPLNPKEVKTPAVLRLAFYDRAIHSGWTGEELQQVKDFLVGKSFEEQMNIIEFYCQSTKSEQSNFVQADVQVLLAHLGKETHYLFNKGIEDWDEYDWSNYRSLEKKATSRIVRKYALYDTDVAEKDKYRVTSPPGYFFSSKEEAEGSLSEDTLATVNIYAVWISE
jgi:hypothetical protein